MTAVSHRFKYLSTALITSALLTACGAEDDLGMFSDASPELASCVIGNWTVTPPEDDTTTITYKINADNTYVIEDFEDVGYVNSSFGQIIANIFWGSNPGDVDPFTYAVSLSSGYWDIRDGHFLMASPSAAVSRITGNSESAILSEAYEALDDSKPWNTARNELRGDTSHCDGQYLSVASTYFRNDNRTYKLVSESPLTYVGSYQTYDSTDNLYGVENYSLILNDNGTAQYSFARTFPDRPSSNLIQEFDATYSYAGTDITITPDCPDCTNTPSPFVLIDHGTALTRGASYLTRQ